MKIPPPASITNLNKYHVPASLNTITREDIELTPARNLYDLIETYVPGATWLTFEEGAQLGIRGIVANRNNKFLLMVNGRVMNNKAHFGALSELEQWDTSDIEKVEVIRGPGSVTYGSGAIGGTINIVTKSGRTSNSSQVTLTHVHPYKSTGIAFQTGNSKSQLAWFAHGSIRQTDGDSSPHYIVSKENIAGYIGEAHVGEPLDYFADAQDKPQLKLHLDFNWRDQWRFWSRYTQQGTTWRSNEKKTPLNDGTLINQQAIFSRHWSNVLQNYWPISHKLALTSQVAFDSMDVESSGENANHPNPNHILNRRVEFSENEVFLRSVLNVQFSESIELALGGEYAWDQFGPGWNDHKDNMRLGEAGVIVSGPNSNAIEPGNKGSADRKGLQQFVGDGWETDTYSAFTELKFAYNDWLTLLASGRGEKSTFTDWLFSPRLAFIANLSDEQQLKLIAQKSVRMNTAAQLYTEIQQNKSPSTENIRTLEAIYSGQQDKLHWQISAYTSLNKVIAWNDEVNNSSHVGDLATNGFESEVSWQVLSYQMGLTYAFTKQKAWELAQGVTYSGVSYADYNLQVTDDISMNGLGNDLNNWANQSLKFYLRKSFKNKLILHVDSQFFWDYQGGKDGLSVLMQAVEGSSYEENVRRTTDLTQHEGAFKNQLRFNASLTYRPNNTIHTQLYVQNLLSLNGPKRYAYDTGNNDLAPRVRFIEEPLSVGIAVKYKY